MAEPIHAHPSSDSVWVPRIQGSMTHISSEEAGPELGFQVPTSETVAMGMEKRSKNFFYKWKTESYTAPQ